MIDGPPDMDTLLANSAAASARAKATWAEALADADAARAIQAAVVARDETAASLMLAMIPTMHAIPSVRPPRGRHERDPGGLEQGASHPRSGLRSTRRRRTGRGQREALVMTSRPMRLADQALAAQYAFAGIKEGNPWWREVMPKLWGEIGCDPAYATLASESIRLVARQAETFTVDTEMTELVAQAAEDLLSSWTEDQAPEMLLPYDVPTATGIVHFAHHIRLGHMVPGADGDDANVGVLGFLWHIGPANIDPTGPRVALTDDPDGPLALGFYPFCSEDFWAGKVEDWQAAIDRFGRPPQYLVHDIAGWHFGKAWRLNTTPWSVEDPEGHRTRLGDDGVREFSMLAALDRVVLFSFFRLVEQRIPRVLRQRPSRPTRRLLTAKPLFTRPPEDGAVHLVTLRRELDPHDDTATTADDTDGRFSHRWSVSPHWARRRVATRDDAGNIIGSTRGVEGKDWTYRRVYIARYTKGPEDRPLVLKDTVGVLRR